MLNPDFRVVRARMLLHQALENLGAQTWVEADAW